MSRPKHLTKTEDALAFINPPLPVGSIDAFEEMLFNNNNISLVEKPVYIALLDFFFSNQVDKVSGDVVNVGIFRGGISIFLRALYADLKKTDKFWLFDSFCGFGKLHCKSEKEKDALEFFNSYLKQISLPTASDVIKNFQKLGLFEDVIIIEGFIEKTYPEYQGEQISLLYIDVDFYGPTKTTLEAFYDKVAKGGCVVIDDYGLENTDCNKAVDEFRSDHNVDSPLVPLGKYQVAWVK